MELQEIINIVKDVSWPAAILVTAVLFLRSPLGSAIAAYIKSKIPNNSMTPQHQDDLSQIKTDVRLVRMNHLHEVVDALGRIEIKLDKMNDNIIWIKSRMNGTY